MSYILTNSVSFGLCNHNQYSCRDFFNSIGDPLFYGMSALAVVFFFLLLFPLAVENWKKFAKWFVPIAALVFIFYDGPGPGDLLSPYPEQVFRWISILYVVASLLIVAWSLTEKRREG
jgi:hypothetical protein